MVFGVMVSVPDFVEVGSCCGILKETKTVKKV